MYQTVTICSPISAFMIDHVGWRAACLIYASLQLVVSLSLPLQMVVIRRSAAPSAGVGAQQLDAMRPTSETIAHERLVFALLAVVLSLAAGIGSIVIVHLMIFLKARGLDFAAGSASAPCSGWPRSAPG